MLTVTMGIPAAGKTHWAQRQPGHTLITTDAIRAARSANRGAILNGVERRARQAITGQRHPIIDSCTLTAATRWRWLHLAGHHDTPARLVVIHCPTEIALTRNASRHYPLPSRVIRDYAEQMPTALDALTHEPWTIVVHLDHNGAPLDITAGQTHTHRSEATTGEN